MTKPKAVAKRTEEKNGVPAAPPNMSVPIGAIPHMFNEKMLEWQKVQYQALAEIHKVLVEIRDVLKG